MTRKKVAILYGGRSVEHGVSINSARNIYEYINKDQFEPIAIGIATSGEWFLTAGITKEISSGRALQLVLNPTQPGWKTAEGETITCDIVFPVLHGTDGEDGSIQGLLKAMNLPMVGTGVLGSAVSINKITAKRLLQESGIPVTRFITARYQQKDQLRFEDIVAKIGLPFMVKAACLGSSVGVSKVKTKEDFASALDDTFRYDDEALFEEFIKGREIECAILGNEPPKASLPGEIIINPKYEFYTFDAKYVDGEAVRIDVPAKMNEAIQQKIQDISIRAYRALHCEDFARVDLFLTEEGAIYVNEINTIPGFTNSSMYPMMWKERGISFSELISRLLDLGLSRYQRSTRVQRDFQSALKF